MSRIDESVQSVISITGLVCNLKEKDSFVNSNSVFFSLDCARSSRSLLLKENYLYRRKLKS